MPRVVLIPTGRMEHAVLGASLSPLFPGVVFDSEPPGAPHSSFTSMNVTHPGRPSRAGAPKSQDKLAASLVAAVVEPGRRRKAADLAVVIEDLELVNDHQPEQVIRVFREAVQRNLSARPWPSQKRQDQAYQLVRQRCSFHLYRPMTEAYFFGELGALQRAGAIHPAQLANPPDLEQFRSTDMAYLGLPTGSKPIKDMPHRQAHPKSYLDYLCDPTLANQSRRYAETVGGAAALRQLDWRQVLALPPHCPFLHAFLDDLAFALNPSPPLSFVSQTHAEPLTRYPGPQNALLRNI
jgi:hypothetical protein